MRTVCLCVKLCVRVRMCLFRRRCCCCCCCRATRAAHTVCEAEAARGGPHHALTQPNCTQTVVLCYYFFLFSSSFSSSCSVCGPSGPCDCWMPANTRRAHMHTNQQAPCRNRKKDTYSSDVHSKQNMPKSDRMKCGSKEGVNGAQ